MKYPKIHTIFKRDQQTGELLIGEYSKPEFYYLRDNAWEFTEKIDGTNIRIIIRPLTEAETEFGNKELKDRGFNVVIKGRTDNAEIPIFLMEELEKIFLTPLMFERISKTFDYIKTTEWQEKTNSIIILYGEGYGNKIQKVGHLYNPTDNDFALFDVLVGNTWLDTVSDLQIADSLQIRYVPYRGQGTLDKAVKCVATGIRSVFGNFPAEGLVLRPIVRLLDHKGERIIAKIKTRDFKKEGTSNG